MLRVAELRRNDPTGEIGSRYGQYGIVADRVGSYDLDRKFPAEVLLRSLAYGSEAHSAWGKCRAVNSIDSSAQSDGCHYSQLLLQPCSVRRGTSTWHECELDQV